MYGSPRRFSVAVFAILLFSVTSAFAQTGTGEIFGRVADRTGAILPGATVTISGDALIQPQSTSSATSGSFRFVYDGDATHVAATSPELSIAAARTATGQVKR